MTLSAPELYHRGRAHLNAGRNAAARRALALAEQRTDDPDLRARITGSLAAVVIRQGQPDIAERMCREALSRPDLSAETSAMLQGQLGLLALERGALDEAVSWLDQGIDGIGDDLDHRPAMLINRSVAHMQAGRLGPAAADLERAAADFAATGDELQRAMAVHNAGYVALLGGDLVGALQQMAEARTVMAAESAVNGAICDLDRAEVLRDAGMTTDAERSLERVAQVFAANRMSQARGEAEYHLARSLLLHRPGDAAQAASRAARTFRRLGSRWWELRADAVRLRALLDAGLDRGGARRTAPSRTQIEATAGELDARGLRADAASLRLTWQLWRARRGDEADPGDRVRVPRGAPIPVRLLAHEVRAARAAGAGDDRAVRRHAAAGLDALADWQASFGSLDLASSLVMHGDGLIFSGLQAAVRTATPDVVFAWSERARHLSQQTVPLRPPPDPDLAAQLAELRLLRSEAGSEEWLGDPRAAELSAQVRERQWTATGSVRTRARVGLDELAAALDGETAFATYVFDGSGMIALAVSGDDRAVVRIAAWGEVMRSLTALRADLDMAASVRSGPLAATIGAALERRLESVSRALVDPVLPVVGDRRLVVTAPGILGGLPWTMLPALRGRAVTIATSASQWVARGPARTPRTAGFVVGPAVARGAEEAATAATAWQAPRTLAEDDATVTAATALASDVDLLHVAAHGRHSRDHPLFSGLELADGALFGYDVDLMGHVPDVVALSACEVGRSTVRGGEEAIGMTRVWLHAGTRCVIAAPVIVADDAACELLAAMHEGLARGAAPAVALAEASVSTGVIAPFQAHGAGF